MSAIVINIDKAREIRKDQLRAEREPLLAALDVEFQRALETGADTTAIVTEKERIRDITLLCDAPDITLEGLKAISLKPEGFV